MQFSRNHGQSALGSILRTSRGLVWLVVTTAAPATVLAAPTSSTALPSFVASTSSCPQAVEVEQEVLGLAPTLYRSSKQVHIEISDTGAEYTVEVLDPKLRAKKSFFDPARDCKRRARFVAVFVVLTLMPPGIETKSAHLGADGIVGNSQSERSDRAGSPDSSSPLTSVPEKRPINSADAGGTRSTVPRKLDAEPLVAANRPRTKSAVRVEAGATFQWTPALFQSLAMTGIGAEVRGLFGRGRLGALVSIGYIKRSTFSAEGINGSMRRAPLVLGIQWRSLLQSFELSTEAGAIAMFERIRGNGFLHSDQNSTVQLGVRLGGTVSSAYGHLVPYLGVYCNAFPKPQGLVAAPPGVVGTTPAIELGITLGGSYAF